MAFADAKSIVCPLGGVKLTIVEPSLFQSSLSFPNFTCQLVFMSDMDPIILIEQVGTSDSQS